MGHVRFVVFYLLCGLAAASAQMLSAPSSIVPMVGASGAIGGVMGAYALLYPRAHVHMFIFLGLLHDDDRGTRDLHAGLLVSAAIAQRIAAARRRSGRWRRILGARRRIRRGARARHVVQTARTTRRASGPTGQTHRETSLVLTRSSPLQAVDPLADQVDAGLVDTVRGDRRHSNGIAIESTHPFPQHAALFRARRDDLRIREPKSPAVGFTLIAFIDASAVSKWKSRLTVVGPPGRWHCEQFTARYARARVATVAFVSARSPDTPGTASRRRCRREVTDVVERPQLIVRDCAIVEVTIHVACDQAKRARLLRPCGTADSQCDSDSCTARSRHPVAVCTVRFSDSPLTSRSASVCSLVPLVGEARPVTARVADQQPCFQTAARTRDRPRSTPSRSV